MSDGRHRRNRPRDYLLLAALLACWEGVARWIVPGVDEGLSRLLPPPSAAVRAAAELMAKGQLLWHVIDSVRRVLTGWAVASVLGVCIGLAMGWWGRLNDQLQPVVEMLRPVPAIAWIPLSILWLGIGETQMAFITGIAAFFAAVVSTVHGVRGVDQGYVRAAECLGATRRAILWRVVFRGALPEIVTGLRVGLGFSWMCLVAAELVAATSGIAFLSQEARYALRIDRVVLTMVLIAVLGSWLDRLLRRIGREIAPWADSFA